MAYTATHKFAHISARKARLVVDQVRGKMLDEALDACRFSKKRAAPMVVKVLKSAQANAREAGESASHTLLISKAVVDEGPTRKKWRARARGMATPIHARTSHIKIELVSLAADTEGTEE
jgi:large subunit ribosomal protein L22